MSYAFTPETLAKFWGVSAATVRSLIRSKRLRAFRVGRSWRIRPDAVTEYERSTETGPEGEPVEYVFNPEAGTVVVRRPG